MLAAIYRRAAWALNREIPGVRACMRHVGRQRIAVI